MSRYYSSTIAPPGRSNKISTKRHIWHCTQNHNTSIPTLHYTFPGLSISLPLSLRAQPCIRTGSPGPVILDTVISLAWYLTMSFRPDINTASSSITFTIPSLSTCTRPITNEDTDKMCVSLSYCTDRPQQIDVCTPLSHKKNPTAVLYGSRSRGCTCVLEVKEKSSRSHPVQQRSERVMRDTK